MKKILILAIFVSSVTELSAQFFQGWGLMGGITYYREKWWIHNVDGSTDKLKMKPILRFDGLVFAEFVNHSYFHWRTEFEYNQKGCIEKTPSGKLKNKVDYISWNNFLKIYEEEFEGTPYLLVGPRVEYLFRQNTQSNLIVSDFRKIHFSWSVGLGWEFTTFGRFKPTVEIHYNPDINRAYKTADMEIINKPWELRIGFRIGKAAGNCPAVYR